MRTAFPPSHQARSVTSSPSSRKLRVSPFGSCIGCLPPWLISSSEPSPPALSVDKVPVPIRSPGWRLQPLECDGRRSAPRSSTSPRRPSRATGYAAQAPRRAFCSVVSVTSSWMPSAPALAVLRIVEIRKRLRVARRPRRHRLAKRRQRFRAHDPRADAGQEILGEERPERLIFPRLEVARRPIVEQAIAGDMVARFADRDRRAELVAVADPDAELELIIEAAAGPIFGRSASGALRWPFGRMTGSPDAPHRACAAVVADRHIFVVRKQRIVGPELLADVGRVMNADVEVGVVADRGTARASALRSGRSAAARCRRDSARRDSSSTGGARSVALRSCPRASQALSTGCERSSRHSSSSRSAMAARSRM